MSAAQQRWALSVFPELKVGNFALLLLVRRTENRINVSYFCQFTAVLFNFSIMNR